MRTYGPRFSFFLLVLAGAALLACGSSPSALRSILVSPASADALNYPDGQVQFAAAGYYSSSSSPVPISVTWSTCNGTSGPSEITVSASGLAQCNPSASGTYFVSAFEPLKAGAYCNVVLACGEAGTDCFGTYGVAKLTCP